MSVELVIEHLNETKKMIEKSILEHTNEMNSKTEWLNILLNNDKETLKQINLALEKLAE